MASWRRFWPPPRRSRARVNGAPMAKIQIIYWRDIPAQVIVSAGRTRARRQLNERFEKAIDRAAIRAKLHGTDDYLEQWRRSDPTSCGDDIETAAEDAAAQIEQDYPDDRIEQIVRANGIDETSE